MSGGYILIIIVAVISMGVQYMFKNRFKKYSKTPLASNMSGAEVAERMLNDNGIRGVKVMSVQGTLTDHYNPSSKTVNLSENVYHGRNAAAVAVAAHECGHAVQDAKAYAFLGFRSAMVPVLNATNRFTPFLLMIGIGLLYAVDIPYVLALGVLALAVSTLFSFVTLPVEFDASRRALKWIEQENIVNPKEYSMAKSALSWAAMTYVVAALSSLATLLYYASILMNRRD
ncbi:putative Zn-dependent protease [Bernardetia litoralis DSM 6794]|uniref:Putative Zn-dependent protease n=1 Tax=Bernardetia litoralis (strain ATCC 23117 / DSM 6794 / NBRC 15988 / NCIMB 1366 / Fx l1 / Sio-4) TaxID=880071 RepID=I4AQP4_BERLS|nr:zinc metallopeptidase [Bernardetia litoralis]AFM06279.1 putative Zn-dependent protease [Bernardetia litoralis DSM 6794]